MLDRTLAWDGCLNVRDLGGLSTTDGGSTRWGSVIRSDNPCFLTETGWSSVHAYGVRTVIALRTVGTTDDEVDERRVPSGITVERVFVEDGTDPDFVERCVLTGTFGSPIYFRTMLERWPDRCAAAVASVAQAPPGGVVISCGRGCDRSGLTAFLLLGLLGVAPEDIAADWLMSVDRLRPREPEYDAVLSALLAREQTTVLDCISGALTTFDVAARLRDGGLTEDDLGAVRRRLLDPAS